MGGEVSDSCSSSIGINSDCSGSHDEKSEEGEVQSLYKGPLDNVDNLESSLPIRRGISKFYNGRSKSFASLLHVSSMAKDIAKPENQYTRKRKNLLALTTILGKNWQQPSGNNDHLFGCRSGNCNRNKNPIVNDSASGSDDEEVEMWPRPSKSYSLIDLQSPPIHSFGVALFSRSRKA